MNLFEKSSRDTCRNGRAFLSNSVKIRNSVRMPCILNIWSDGGPCFTHNKYDRFP
jgi:hypothetical protein